MTNNRNKTREGKNEMTEENLVLIHEELLKLLLAFDDICRTNNIVYSICAGTLLGAVREKGFIPWDDDADLLMAYKDYCSLKQALENNNEFFLDEEDTWVPRFRQKKIKNGPFVDIFWLTNDPNSRILHTLKVTKLRVLQGMLKTYKTEHKISGFYKVLTVVARDVGMVFPREKLLKIYKGICIKEESEDTKYFQVPNGSFYGVNIRYDKKMNDGHIDIMFEGHKLMAIKRYEYLLNITYGPDYMTPPPIDQRYGGHSNQINLNSNNR